MSAFESADEPLDDSSAIIQWSAVFATHVIRLAFLITCPCRDMHTTKALRAGTSAFRRGRMDGSCFRGNFQKDADSECARCLLVLIRLSSVQMLSWVSHFEGQPCERQSK